MKTYTEKELIMKNTMLLITSILVLSFWGCEEEVDTTPPDISIASPVDGAIVSDTITIKTVVADNDGINNVEFYLDGDLLATVSEEPFQTEWNTSESSNGEHTLQCKAVDNSDNETLSESILIEVANPYPLPTEFPLVDNTAWVYKLQRYNSATEYLLDMNPEIFLDTLYIFSSPEDYFLYSWQPTEYFSMVINYDNKLLNIGFINLISDTLYFYEKPNVWAVYDEVFDTTIISQHYELNGIFNRYEVEDSLFNHTYLSYVTERENAGLGNMNSFTSIEGFSKWELFWDEIDFYSRDYMYQKLEGAYSTSVSIGIDGVKYVHNNNLLRQLPVSPKTIQGIIE